VASSTIIVSYTALAVSVLSLAVTVANVYLSGPAARMTLRTLVTPSIPKERYLTEVGVFCTGRTGVQVEAIELRAAHKPFRHRFRGESLLLGPELPHKLQGGESQRWFIEVGKGMKDFDEMYPNNGWKWQEGYKIKVKLGTGRSLTAKWRRTGLATPKDFDIDNPPWW
jgi:hypothetical protein